MPTRDAEAGLKTRGLDEAVPWGGSHDPRPQEETKMRVLTTKLAAFVVPVLMIAGLAARLGAADETTALPAAACASLQGLTIPAASIGLETSGAEVQTEKVWQEAERLGLKVVQACSIVDVGLSPRELP